MSKNIAVLGNSHVRYFLGELTSGDDTHEFDLHGHHVTVAQFGITGATAWGLSNPQSRTGAGEKVRNYLAEHDDIDLLVLVFGEVDVRDHIKPRANAAPNTPIASHVIPVIERYGKFLESLNIHRSRHVALAGCVPYSVSAVSCDPHINDIAIVFNYYLRAMAENHGFLYLDLFTDFTGPDGALLHVFGRNPNNPAEPHLDHDAVEDVVRANLLDLLDCP